MTAASGQRRTPDGDAVAITGWSAHVPGVAGGDLGPGLGSTPAEPADQAHRLLGRKGLRYRDEATRLALCAVHRLLGLEPGAPRRKGPPNADTAVVASCNLGNVQLVRELTRTVRESGGHAVSPLEAPNASSNVVASAVALWFRWGGPNFLICSGDRSGFDALAVGALLLRAHRAEEVIVVGCEPADPVATEMHARHRPDIPLRAAAAAVRLQRADDLPRRPFLLPQDLSDTEPVPGACGASGVLWLAVSAARSARGGPVIATDETLFEVCR